MCLDDVKGWELKEGKRKACPKCGFASYDRYAPLSRSGSRYILATHRYSGIHAQNASRKFIWNQPSGFSSVFPQRMPKKRPMVSSLSSFLCAAFFPSSVSLTRMYTEENRGEERDWISECSAGQEKYVAAFRVEKEKKISAFRWIDR